ncbi:hypothetical protein [Mycolicibacterium houstonense]|uniref:hypothetical protein n=1 Tax=Mycolicibacterium houstonense TaxID=146021 RepID=UPI00082F1E5D|nr:hypothetical protein [Mycolicibacterium houstonense]
MAKIESRSDVRRKVREAQTRAQQERLKRESDNREDMVAFLLAEQKLQAVDGWEAEHLAQVRGEAEQRRHEQRVEGAKALARLKARGETIKDIAALGDVSEKLVRSYLKLAAQTPSVRDAAERGSQALGSGETRAASPEDPQALGDRGRDADSVAGRSVSVEASAQREQSASVGSMLGSGR